jgi:hypothetical protein
MPDATLIVAEPPMLGETHLGFSNLDRLRLATVSGACIALFYNAAQWLHWPAYLKFEASLLASTAPLTGIALTVVLMLASVLLATALLGKLRYEAGLFAGCIGLSALANRGGAVSSMMRSIGEPRLYLTMLLESIMLLGLVGLSWQMLAVLAHRHRRHAISATSKKFSTAWSQRLLATGLQASITGVLMMLIVQSDSRKQVLAAVVIASLLGSLIAHQSLPTRPSAIFWTGPFIVAIAGYAWAMRAPGQWQIGIPANHLAAASPLDYASLGTAGAIFGYWISTQWHEVADLSDVEVETLD